MASDDDIAAVYGEVFAVEELLAAAENAAEGFRERAEKAEADAEEMRQRAEKAEADAEEMRQRAEKAERQCLSLSLVLGGCHDLTSYALGLDGERSQDNAAERSIWTLAEKAQAEVDKWPEWKRNAADMALTTPRGAR